MSIVSLPACNFKLISQYKIVTVDIRLDCVESLWWLILFVIIFDKLAERVCEHDWDHRVVWCYVVCSIASGLTADTFRASFLQQCREAGISDLTDVVISNAHESHKHVRHTYTSFTHLTRPQCWRLWWWWWWCDLNTKKTVDYMLLLW